MSCEIIFLGTGTSEGVPRISCLTQENITCSVCQQSIESGNKNRRRNTSILIRYIHPVDKRDRFIMIDVGKFFWHSALDWLVKYKIPRIDAIIITHDHFDAIGGLDDLRDWSRTANKPIPIFLRSSDYTTIRTMFPYLTKAPPTQYSTIPGSDLVDPSPAKEIQNNKIGRIVPELEFVIIDPDKPFIVEGLEFEGLPVYHGGEYICLGYKFGKQETVAYISDTNLVPDSTREKVKGVDLLILDCLFIDTNYSHFSKEEALQETRKIRAKKTLFIGMNHVLEHDATNQELAQLGDAEAIDVQLAYDGLKVELHL